MGQSRSGAKATRMSRPSEACQKLQGAVAKGNLNKQGDKAVVFPRSRSQSFGTNMEHKDCGANAERLQGKEGFSRAFSARGSCQEIEGKRRVPSEARYQGPGSYDYHCAFRDGPRRNWYKATKDPRSTGIPSRQGQMSLRASGAKVTRELTQGGQGG